MKKYSFFPFYRSLRFRFGLLFNLLLALFLSGIIFILFSRVQSRFEESFIRRLALGGNLILQKTDISPLTVPLPQPGEYFLISYNNGYQTDTLFNDLPVKPGKKTDSIYRGQDWWSQVSAKKLETGGIIRVEYMLSARDFNASMRSIKTLLFIYIPLSIVIALLAGYFLSGIFLRPLQQIINKANSIDLSSDIALLDEPVVKDELHQLADAINRMLLRIQKQSQQQNNFFASASHELRTPLSNMMTELQTAETRELPADTKALLANQLSEVKRLKELVNNFLTMSQLKADALPVHKSTFNIVEHLLEWINAQKTAATQNDLTIKMDLQPADGDFMVVADKGQLSVVFGNLIGNAIKYSVPGTTISILVESLSNTAVTIENETAAGMQDWESFKQEFKRGNAGADGVGLGLWIADQLLALNEGELHVYYHKPRFTAAVRLKTFNNTG